MASSSIFCSTHFIRSIPSSHICLPSSVSYVQQHNHCKKREFPLPSVASVSSYQPINIDYLEEEFNGHGVTFEGVGGGSNSYIAKMELRNGSIANMLLPSGLITSYKAPMWHGGKVELLHTAVSEGEEYGDAIIQGGVSLNFSFQSDDGGEEVSWSPTNWVLHNIKGNSEDSIQVCVSLVQFSRVLHKETNSNCFFSLTIACSFFLTSWKLLFISSFRTSLYKTNGTGS